MGQSSEGCRCREARTKLSKRPWRVDQFDEFAGAWFSGPASPSKAAAAQQGTQLLSPFRRVIMFVDNAGRHLTQPVYSIWP